MFDLNSITTLDDLNAWFRAKSPEEKRQLSSAMIQRRREILEIKEQTKKQIDRGTLKLDPSRFQDRMDYAHYVDEWIANNPDRVHSWYAIGHAYPYLTYHVEEIVDRVNEDYSNFNELALRAAKSYDLILKGNLLIKRHVEKGS